MLAPVFLHVRGLVAGGAGLDVKQPAVFVFAFRIVDAPHHAVGAVDAVLQMDRPWVNHYVDAEIIAAFADSAAQSLEPIVGICFSVNGNHVTATSPDQLVHSQVLKMSAIGKVQ